VRTLTGAQNTTLSSSSYAVHFRVRVENAAGALVDLSTLGGQDWVDGVSIREDVDSFVSAVDVRLRRDAGSLSLAPLVELSSLNTGGAVLDAGRAIVVDVSTVAFGSSPSWVELWRGEIDRVAWEQTPIVLTCRGEFCHLVDAWVEEAREYGPDPEADPPEADWPLETLIQAILDDWAPGTTLYTPVSPGALAGRYKQQQESVEAAISTLAGTIGWVVRPKWDSATGAWRLTFFEPARTKTVPDWTFGPEDYFAVTALSIDREAVRNVVDVHYLDAATGLRTKVTATDAASVARFRRRWMGITEADDSPISTSTEAQALADAALSDLSLPFAEHEIETLFWWPGELGDLYRFSANGVHYDVAQDWAAAGIRHELSRDKHRTFLRVRGKPCGYYENWLSRGRQGAAFLSAVFWGARVVGSELERYDISLRVQGVPEAFPVTARIFEGSPDTETPAFTHVFTGDGEQIGPLDYPENWDNYAPPRPPELPWFAELTAANGIKTWAACKPATAKPASPDYSLTNFRVSRDEAAGTATARWTRGSKVHTVRAYVTEQARNSSADPWPDVYVDTPDAVLAVGADSFTLDLPAAENLTFLTFLPVAEDGTTYGPAVQYVLEPLPAAGPYFAFIRHVETGATTAHLYARIVDPAGTTGGVLSVWINRAGFASPNPASARDGWVDIPGTPADVGIGTIFNVTGGGTSALLQSVSHPTNASKHVYFEYVAADGRTTGKVDYTLGGWLTGLVDEVGVLRANSIINAQQLSEQLRPYLILANESARLSVIDPQVGDRVYCTAEGSAWRWTGTMWQAIDSSYGFFPAISAGAIRSEYVAAGAITAVKLAANSVSAGAIQAGAVTATHINVATLSEIADDAGIVVSGLLRNVANTAGLDLDATGAAEFLYHPALSLRADGSATFAGNLVAAGGTFAGEVSGISGTFETLSAGVLTGPELTIDLAATGAQAVLQHDKFVLRADGTAEFAGLVSQAATVAAELFTAANASFANAVTVGGNLQAVLGWFTSLVVDSMPLSFGANDSAGAGYRLVRVPNA
jgi:hypothetical protein